MIPFVRHYCNRECDCIGIEAILLSTAEIYWHTDMNRTEQTDKKAQQLKKTKCKAKNVGNPPAIALSACYCCYLFNITDKGPEGH